MVLVEATRPGGILPDMDQIPGPAQVVPLQVAEKLVL
jgi:hypothetical protein